MKKNTPLVKLCANRSFAQIAFENNYRVSSKAKVVRLIFLSVLYHQVEKKKNV